MVAGTDLVSVTQRRLFDALGPDLGLRIVPVDFAFPTITNAMFWHPRKNRTPAHLWMREQVQLIASRL
jgi:DNA-binding transcriptional LysR family regulator